MFDPIREVPSLELCKELKELGYPQTGGGWYWIKPEGDQANCAPVKGWDLYLMHTHKDNLEWWFCKNFEIAESRGCGCCADYFKVAEYIKAPTVVEMEEWYPFYCPFESKTMLSWKLYKEDKDDWTQEFMQYTTPLVICQANNRADLCAKNLIWLIKNGYMNFKDKKGESNE